MENVNKFTDLATWQECHKLVLLIYKATKLYPKEEMFCLVNQMRRAVVSITSNIAEGFGRQSIKEKIQFYSIAAGSLTELQNQLIISKDLNYISSTEFEKFEILFTNCHRLVNGLVKSTKNRLA